ncbi:MAG: hypothetical protein P8123_10355, partial [bacterium]
MFGYYIAGALVPAINRRDRLIISFPLGAGFYTLAIFCLNSSFGALIRPPFLWWLLGICILLACAGAVLRARGQHYEEGESPLDLRIPLTTLAKSELALLLGLVSILTITAVLVPVECWDVYSEYLPRAKEIYLT